MNSPPPRPSRRNGTLAGALALGCLLASGGCATATRVALGDVQRSQIASVKTVAALSQQELGVAIVQSTAGASAGLIGAVIDSSVNNSRVKTAEAAAVPVRDALVTYDPSAAIGAALSRELRPIAWLKRNSIETRSVAGNKSAVAELVKKSGADMLLLVQTDYRLTPEFDALVVTAKVSLFPLTAPPPADAEEGGEPPAPAPVYFNTLTASTLLSGFQKGMPLDAAARLWAANGGQGARRALDGGLGEVARLVAFDLQQGAPEKAAYEPPAEAKTVEVPAKYASGNAQGYVVRTEGGRFWVRLRSGELNSAGTL